MENLFGSGSSWWRARTYEIIGDSFIAPGDGCRFPGDFEEYDPLEVYYSGQSSSPHLDLLNLEPFQVYDVLHFVEKWGLLGTALRSYSLGIDALMNGANTITEMSWGEQRILSEVRPSNGYMEYWSGSDYFERCFKKHPDEVAFGEGNLWENYGEWVDPGPELTGDPKKDEYRVQSHGGVAEHYQTFSDNARQFQDYYRDVQQGKGRIGLSSKFALGWKLYVQPNLQRIGDSLRMGFEYSSLLDACYLMVMLDAERDSLRQCPECRRFWRHKGNTRQNRIYCPPEEEHYYFVDPMSQGCGRRANNRKSNQRGSWMRFLQNTAPEIIPDLTAKNGKIEHPYDVSGEMSDEAYALARQWAEQVFRKSPRSYDMWLEPFHEG